MMFKAEFRQSPFCKERNSHSCVRSEMVCIRGLFDELEMCQYDTHSPAPGTSSPGNKHVLKKKKKQEVEKRAITPIIIG